MDMEGSESEAVFNSFDLNPQGFINEVLNSVDDMVDGAFDYYHQEAVKFVGAGAMEKASDLEKGVVMLKKMLQRGLDQKLGLWEKYCLSHVFSVPDGFSLPEKDTKGEDISINQNQLTDLDAELDCLRNKLTKVGKETVELSRELQSLEKKAASSNRHAAAVNEILQIYEQNSGDDMFQDMMQAATNLSSKLERLNSIHKKQIEEARYERIHNSSVESSILTGFSKSKLEDIQKFVLDMESMVN